VNWVIGEAVSEAKRKRHRRLLLTNLLNGINTMLDYYEYVAAYDIYLKQEEQTGEDLATFLARYLGIDYETQVRL
jgi:hypothetical protein